MEELNYIQDSRVRAKNERWYKSLDVRNLKATVSIYNEETGEIQTVEVPIKLDVCPTCTGIGSHVNPSIDASGLSSEDLHEDPDFAEDYFKGTYDVTCYDCEGRAVVPICLDEKVRRCIDRANELNQQYVDEIAAERRMGA